MQDRVFNYILLCITTRGCHGLFAASYGCLLEELEGFRSRASEGKGASTVSAAADAAMDVTTADILTDGYLETPPTKNSYVYSHCVIRHIL